jgi:hypothetical protein
MVDTGSEFSSRENTNAADSLETAIPSTQRSVFLSKLIEYSIVVIITLVTLFIIYYITKEHWTLILFVTIVLTVTVLLTRAKKSGTGSSNDGV